MMEMLRLQLRIAFCFCFCDFLRALSAYLKVFLLPLLHRCYVLLLRRKSFLLTFAIFLFTFCFCFPSHPRMRKVLIDAKVWIFNRWSASCREKHWIINSCSSAQFICSRPFNEFISRRALKILFLRSVSQLNLAGWARQTTSNGLHSDEE